ncbi:MAG TPA: ABC transporter permease subunit [Candidatus Polarisedimenticolia bacterium]|nr:ABC transporter permease subunit [Candidatus Polarisedimenticolia bacterium]
MTLLRLALRSHRTGLLGTGMVVAAGGFINALGFAQIAGDNPAARAVFAQQMELLARQLTYLLPSPSQLDTMAGYLTWRWFGSAVLVYAFWALLAGTGAGRGDEERGLAELWLSTGVSRLRFIAVRVVGFAAIAALSILVMLVVTDIGATIGKEPLDIGLLALEGLATWALTLFVFAFAVFVSQLVTTRRGATGIAGIVVLALFMLNSAARSGVDIGAIRWLSPFYLFERSTPLLRGGLLDIPATAALAVGSLVLVAIAVVGFVRRDIGGPLFRGALRTSRVERRPAGDPLLRAPILAIVDQQRVWIVGWAIGLVVLAGFLASITKVMVDAFGNSDIPMLRAYFERAGINAYADFVGVIWFSTLLLLISLFVAVQVNGWAADDAEGRLETILSAPVSRARVVVERIAAVVIACALLVAASSVAVYLTATSAGISLPSGRFVFASAAVLPVAYAFSGIGHALVGWRPRVAVAILGALAVVGYFTQQFAPIFQWPEWTTNLSLFALYGTPMSKDDWGGIATLVAIGLAGTAVAIVAMRRRDVGR